MKLNADGSATLYVGHAAPTGYENNWIPTASGGACSLFIDVVGRPLTPVSVAGVARRTTRRTVRRTVY